MEIDICGLKQIKVFSNNTYRGRKLKTDCFCKNRTSRLEVFCKKGALKNFAKCYR